MDSETRKMVMYMSQTARGIVGFVNENPIDRWDIVNILKGPEGYMMFYYRNRTAEDNNIR